MTAAGAAPGPAEAPTLEQALWASWRAAGAPKPRAAELRFAFEVAESAAALAVTLQVHR